MADTSLSEKKIGVLVWQLSNHWQSKLRNILRKENLTLNEYLVLEGINYLKQNKDTLAQIDIALYAGIDISVVSVTLKLLEKKKLITRQIKEDNRKKIIEMLADGKNLYNKLYPLILEEEMKIFSKLRNETINFTNLLKLLLGKRLRIKADIL